MTVRKTNRANLRNRYPLYVEIGFTLSLGILVLAFRLNLKIQDTPALPQIDQELIQTDEIQPTRQFEKPPPPPRPPVPVEVPNSQVLDDVPLELDTFLDVDRTLNRPPPPAVNKVEEPEPELFFRVEEKPVLIGGLAGLQGRIRYPEIARKAGVEGRVFLQFIVDEQGNVTSAEVTRGIGAGCDEEAIKAILQAKFEPGRQRGKPVRVKMSLPVNFRIR